MDENTNNAQSRFWNLVLNNWDEQDRFTLQTMLGVDYRIIAKEIGENGTPHLQCFFVFTNRKRLSQVIKLTVKHGHWYIKAKDSTIAQAAGYCRKDNDFFEDGVLPLDRSVSGGQATKAKWDEMWDHAKNNSLCDIEAKYRVQYYASFKRISQDYQVAPPDIDGVCGEWFYGPPDTGKSRAARALYPDYYDKPCNKWWDGYRGAPFVIIDDFDKIHNVLGHHLKRWGDRYAFPAEHKGHTFSIRPKKVIVTSNYTPDQIWGEDPVLCQAIKRRFKLTEFQKNAYNPWCQKPVIERPDVLAPFKPPALLRVQPQLWREVSDAELQHAQDVADVVSRAESIMISISDSEDDIAHISLSDSEEEMIHF